MGPQLLEPVPLTKPPTVTKVVSGAQAQAAAVQFHQKSTELTSVISDRFPSPLRLSLLKINKEDFYGY